MKKNVKYIGSAVAVALLAAGAPVVVPMLMPVTIVEAGNNYNPPADPYTYFSAFKKQWADQYVSNNQAIVGVLKGKIGYLGNGQLGNGFSYFDPDHPDYFKDFQDDPDVAKLKSFSDPYTTEDSNSNYYYRDVLGSITVYDGNGKQILLRNNADYNAAIDNFNNDDITYPLTLRIRLVTNEDDKDYNPHTLDDPEIVADKSLTDFSFTVNKSEFDVTSDPAVSVVGTPVANINSGNDSLSIVDKYTTDGGALKTRTPIYGQSLFSSESAAVAYSEKSDFSPDTTNGGDVSDAVSSGKVAKAGVYYQTVSYKVDNSDDAAITAMINKTEDENTKKPVDPYDTRINTVKKVEGTNYSFNYSTKMLTIARPVTVTDNATPVLNPINVTVNSSSKSDKLTDTTAEYLQDNLKNKLNTTGVSFGSDYYSNSSATDKVTDLIDANGNFTKSGVYYRKVTFTLPDGEVGNLKFSPEPNEKGTNTVTFTQEINVQDAANTKIATPATANIGDKTSVSTATDGNDITDKDGTSLLVKSDSHPDGVSFGTDYYEISPTDANKQAILNDPTKVDPATTDVVKDGVFNRAGTYLRTITFYLTQQDIANNTFNGDDPNVKVSKANSTVTYVQTITISPNEVTPTVNDVHTAIGTSVTDSGLHDSSTVTLPSGDDSLLDKTKGDNDSGISFGNDYYDDSTLQNKTADISTSNRLTTAKTYHRLVTFYLTDTAYNQSQFNGSYSHNDQDKSVSYVQTVIVDPSTKTATFGNHDLEVPYNTATNSSTLTGTSAYTLADDSSKDSIKANASLDGNIYASESDAKARINALTVDKLTDSTYYRVITIKVNSGDGYTYSYPGADKVDAENDEVQYIQKISVDKDIATISVPSESVASGSVLSKIKNSTNTITDGSGNTIGTGVVGTTYYDNPTDAINNGSDTSSRIITDGSVKRVTGPAGTMYRTVTFTLNSGAGSNYTFKGADGDVEGTNYKIDGDTVTYAQPINITINKVTTVSIAPKTANVGSSPADITTDATDITVKYSTGIISSSLIDTNGTVKYGTTYYDKDTKAVDNDVLDAKGNFSKSGSFYREVTIPLKDNYASSYDFNINNQYVSVDTVNDTVTYLQEVDVNAEQGKGDAPDKHTYTGVPIKDLNTPSDYTLTSSDGTENLSSGVSFGTKYYPTAQDAAAGTNEIANADTNGDFDDAGDYYREVTFTLTPEAASKYAFTDEFNGEKPIVTKTDDVTTVTYIQHIHVDKNIATATLAHEKVVADSNTTDVPQPDPALNTLLDKNIPDGQEKGHTVVTNDGKDVTADNSQYYDSPENYDPNNTSKYVVNGKFTKAGTYYRRITFNLIPGISAADEFNGKDVVLVDKTDNSVTYLQAVDVTLNTAVANIVDASAAVGQSVNPGLNNDETSDIKNSVDSIVSSISYGDSYYKNSTDFMNGVNPIGKTFATAGEFYRVITFKLNANALDGNTLDDTIHTTTTNPDGTISVSYAQKVTVASTPANVNIAGTTTTINNIASGSSVGTEQSGETNEITGITSDGSEGSLKDGNVQFGTGYYSTDDANNTVANILNGASTIKATDGVVSGDSYVKPGTYYRTVTVPLKDGASSANSFDPKTSKLSADGKSITYVQSITIEQGKSDSNIAGTKTSINDVNTGSSVKTEQSGETNDVTGITSDGSEGSLKDGDVQFGTDYYLTDDANNTVANILSGSSVIKATDGVVSGDKYAKSGTYYRTVTVPLKDGASLVNSFDPKTSKLSVDGKSITYVQSITIGQSKSTSNIAGTTTAAINVAADSNVGTEQSGETNDVTGITSNGSQGSLKDGNVQFGTDYYSTDDTNNTVANILNGASTIKATDGVVSGDSYVKPGTYYRTITVPLKDGASSANSFDPNTSKLSADGKSVTYIQTITIGKNDLNTGDVVIKNLNVKVDGDTTPLTTSDGYKLTDKAGNNLIDTTQPNNGVNFSSDYIDTTTGKTADPTDASGAKITKAGTYTRQVIFSVTDDAIKNNDFTAIGGKLDPVAKTVTFTQTVTASTNPATSSVTNPSVSSGTNAGSDDLKNPKDVSVTDENGNDITSGAPTFGGIFKTPEAAKADIPAGGDATGNLPAGTYYQKVTVPLKGNDANAYDFGPNATVDKTNNTVTYIRTITVNQSTGGGGSNADDEWTYFKNPGVVTTKTDQDYYYMNHKDNSAVTNRTLGKDSSWLTDQYRTNRAGVKQYRVATDEWVDSRYVYFADRTTDNNNTDDEWTYYKAPGIVTTKTDQDYYYMNHKDDSIVDNRTLGKDSSWITDQYRTNREGVKQYRVATDEWVDSNSVIFTQNVITGISPIKGIVNLDSTNAYYMLYTKEGDVVGNRALKEKSSWLVDEIGRDAQGNVYYRVATNEWVKVVPGVYFDSKAWY